MSMSSFFPAVHEPAYAMSTATSRPSSSMYIPFPGSPGSAIIGFSDDASTSMIFTYSAPSSEYNPSISFLAASLLIPRWVTR
jgi:hypothetical protein